MQHTDMQHTDAATIPAPAGPGRHRARTRFGRLHALGLAGLAVLGVGLTAGTASADPTAQDWSKIRQCESGGNYSINTGNGYYGAYQFDLGTWRSVGGSGRPSDASPAEQDARALALWRSRGWGPWACARLVSLSNGTAPPQAAPPPRAAPPKAKPPQPPYPRINAGTAARWTEHLFRTVLGGTGGPHNPFAAALTQGQGSYSTVATFVATSRQRLNQVVVDGYARCLRRGPDQSGLDAYSPWLKNNSLSGLYVQLCASNEAFSKSGRNTPRWVDSVFVALFNRHATASEQANWTNYTAHYGRAASVNSLANSPTWRNLQTDYLYLKLLGRHADASGRAAYAGYMSGRGIFTATVSIARSAEFARAS